MKDFRLSPRLSAIAEFIPYGARLVDVGTDHGYLPVWAFTSRQCPTVIATDINNGPLHRAERFASEMGVEDSIEFRLCDGLMGIEPEICDTVIIAGMGGETISGILQRAPWTGDGKHLLILQPMTRDEVLLRWLGENGYAVTGGRLVREGDRIRQIITAVGGTPQMPLQRQFYAGAWLAGNKDPLLGEYLNELCDKLRRIADALRHSAKPYDKLRLYELEADLDELEKMKTY